MIQVKHKRKTNPTASYYYYFNIYHIYILLHKGGRVKIKGVYSDIRQKTRILGELRQDINTWKTQRRDHTAI